MKTITKIFASSLAAIAIFTTTNLNAQTMTTTDAPMMESGMGFKVGVGISGGVFRDKSPLDYAYGADVKLQWDLTPYVAVTASGGYTKLMGKDNVLDVDFIPAKGGVKVFPIKRMYLATEAGAGFAIQDGAKTNFIYTGGLGYEFGGFDVGVRYEGYVNDSGSTLYFKKTGQYALRLAYNFKL
ncbi:hypothetical protein EZ449_18215 [Pedobacter frigidisoli]|uniref:Outer membrane protein beta-barrel domain-containing protein n=1 Tax=Pedobacter frigidisoli TaxID=2530455 RepID=A0A4R0NYS5_9SPHI|nr:hypothetical protein [Pedobacter frigidisoli]TCD04244.1 hypothetical protein EZ449_18215 [Pedobacter frigidisoli]